MKAQWVQTDEKRAEILQARVEAGRATVEEIIEFARIVSRLPRGQEKPSTHDQRACEILREGVRRFPDDPCLLRELARKIHLTSRHESQRLLRKALRAYKSRGDFDCVDSIANDLAEDPFCDGLDALHARDYVKAEGFFRRAIRIYPFHANAWGHLGIAHEKRGNWLQAGRCYWRGMQFGRICCHEIELNNRRMGDAKTHYWGEYDTRPFLLALYNWAQLLYRRKKFQSALDYAEESLLANPNDNTGARDLAYSILRLLGNKSEMRKLARLYAGESLPHEADELEARCFGSRIGQPRQKGRPN